LQMQMTAQALMATETRQAVAATASYEAPTAAARGTATAVSVIETREMQAELDALALQQKANDLEATRAAATATLGADIERQELINEAERITLEDYEQWLMIQRQREIVAVQRAEQWVWLRPIIIGGAFLLVLIAGAAWLWLHRPIPVADGQTIALPRNRYQISGPPRLAAPLPQIEIPSMLPPVIELPSLTKGHVLLVSESGGGKTICLREIVDQRTQAGTAVTVLDPHYMPGAWGNSRVISSDDGMNEYLQYALTMLDERIEQRRNDSQRHFDPITIATEEMPALVDRLGKNILYVWKRLMREGRKFSINIAIVTQSTRVKTLGIKGEGDLVEQFNAIIELGTVARRNYPDLVAGMRRPAIIRMGNEPPRPIIIPYDPRKDTESDQFIPFWPFQQRPGEITAPPPQVSPLLEAAGMQTKWGFVTQRQIDGVLRLMADGHSGAEIERQVFGYAGGAAYHMRQAIRKKYGATNATNVAVSGENGSSVVVQ